MASDWHGTDAYRPQSDDRRGRDVRIERICGRQEQLIRLEQLVAAGLGPRAVSHRVEAHRLFRIHRGVFACHPPPYGRHQLYLAAVYACGPGSALSDLPAGGVLALTETLPPLPHVTNAGGAGKATTGIRVHRRAIDPQDIVIRHGIPCTSAARTVFDCASSLQLQPLEDLLMAADAARILDRCRLQELIGASRGQPGTRKLLYLTGADPVETRSINERRMLTICRRFGVAEPLVNHRIEVGTRTFYADFCWPELRLIVEADSWRWHGGRQASEDESDRDQLLSLAGWRVVHFTRDQIKRQSERTGRRLVALTAPEAAHRAGDRPLTEA